MMPRSVVAVAATAALLASAPRLGAQDMLRSWVTQVLVTAATTTVAEVIAERPGIGAILGIGFSFGQAYIDLRINDWEIDETTHGAGLIGPIVVGVGLTIALRESRGRGRWMGHRTPLDDPCVLTGGRGGRIDWTHPDRSDRVPPVPTVTRSASAETVAIRSLRLPPIAARIGPGNGEPPSSWCDARPECTVWGPRCVGPGAHLLRRTVLP